MPNIKSAIKRVRTSTRQHDRNVAYRSAMRTSVRFARTALNENPGEAAGQVKQAVSIIDHLVSKGVMHANTAARKKSRLMKKLYYASRTE